MPVLRRRQGRQGPTADESEMSYTVEGNGSRERKLALDFLRPRRYGRR